MERATALCVFQFWWANKSIRCGLTDCPRCPRVAVKQDGAPALLSSLVLSHTGRADCDEASRNTEARSQMGLQWQEPGGTIRVTIRRLVDSKKI